VAQVGWGLNLAMVASISLAIAGLVAIATFRDDEWSVASAPDLRLRSNVPEPPAVPEGWYQDPENPSLLRYWTGSAWTSHTAHSGELAGSI
jgi:hypothetical protein